MKRTLLGLAMILATGSASATMFTNGGFESGDLSGWTGGGGYWSGVPDAPVDPSIYNSGTPNNTVVGAGTDAITGANTVFSGNYAVRVNDANPGSGVSTLRQSVTGYEEDNIFFAWNAVLEGSHGLTDSDYFSLTLTDDTTGTTLVSRSYSSAGSIGDGTSGVNWSEFGGWLSSGWVVENIDLAELGVVGHDFTLTLLASDCAHSGHAGYVYLDGFGAENPPPSNEVPEPSSLILLSLGALALGLARRRTGTAA